MFDETFSSPDAFVATADLAWIRAMLDVEAALADACAAHDRIPAGAAVAIAAACANDLVEPGELARATVASATPVIPLVTAIRAAVGKHAEHVHVGATSQDVVDTAMMLVISRTLPLIDADLAGCSAHLAELAQRHRGTPQIGRTLLQHAQPTTFGAVTVGWLAAVEHARAALGRLRPAVQLGGPVGTLDTFDGLGPRIAQHLADSLGLAYAPPWHTDRSRVAEAAAALGLTAGALGKIALDVTLLAQSEVGEVREEAEGGRSSAMPHKRNPARAVLVNACVHRVPALVGTVFAGLPQELQRSTGRWQAEWPGVTDLLRLTAGAAYHCRAMLGSLRVDPARMADNLRTDPRGPEAP